MPHFLGTFKSHFHLQIINGEKILETEIYHPEGDPELIIIYKFKRFLEPFKLFDYNISKENELIKLLSILKNTEYILKNCHAVVKNETDIYKQVKWVSGLYYPSCRELSRASFIQQFKTYHPDILINELKVAIEYKHIKSNDDNLDNYIDQIRVDASNYKGDNRYENFIAVIYLENTSVATPENILVAWKAKEFPKNWELIVVNGSPNKESSK